MNAARASTEARGPRRAPPGPVARRVSPSAGSGQANRTGVIPRSSRVALLFLTLLPIASTVHAQNSFPEDTSGRVHPSRGQQPPPPGPATRMPAPGPAPSDQPMPLPSPTGNQPGSGAGAGDGYGDAVEAGSDPRFAQVGRIESEDFGVPPADQLRQDQFHAPTPTRIPGGLVITTEALNTLYQQNQGQFIVFDVLAGPQGLPGAQNARPAGQGGSFNDPNQREFGNYLQSVTQGNKQVPLVFYCQNNYCWLSYNAALRAIKLGYTQVLWYRGGIEAWQQAGLPVYPRGN